MAATPIPQDLSLIGDLALVLAAAGIVALLFHRLKLPAVLGYLAAGVLVGHAGPIALVRREANIDLLAQLGVLFLLFSIGLDFHLRRLRKVGGLALGAGVMEVALMVMGGFIAAHLFGWRGIDALFIGAMLAISSTTIVAKVLSDLGHARAPSSEAIIGILLVEDLVAVLLMALLSTLAATGRVEPAQIAGVTLRLAVFIIAALVVGILVVPRLVDFIARIRAEEILLLVVLAFAFATSLAAVALGLSLALGAFLAGAIVAESRASATVERRVAPLRDVFAAVFFVSIGILLDPADLIAYWPVILLLALITIVGKVVAVSIATFVAGYPPHQAIRVGLGMAMIGEFSFVIATQGRSLGVTSNFLFPIAVGVSAITTLVTPFLIRHSDAVVAGLARVMPADLRAYASTYSAWVGRVRPREGEAFAGRYDKAAIARLLVFLGILGGLALAASGFFPWYGTWSGGTRLATIAYFAAFFLASIPILIGAIGSARRVVRGLADVVFPPERRAGPAAIVLRNTLYFFLLVVVALVALAAGIVFLPAAPLLIGALLIVLVAGSVLRRSLRRLNEQVEQAVDSVLTQAPAPGSRDQVLTLIRERYPWDLHVASVIVSVGSRAANRRIRDLALPQKTGATIVTHERDGRQVVNPPPDTILIPGDTIGVLGESEQVEAAQVLLTAEAPTSERPAPASASGIALEEIEIMPGSPMDGLTLAGSRIRETTGATVVGVRREGVPLLNPAPVMRLRPGDTVVVLGSPDQVRAARMMFRVATG